MVYYFSFLTLTLCLVLFVFNARINRSILYLIGFLVPLAVYGIFHHLVFFNDSAFKLALINIQFLPLYYLAGPMIYFYVRSTLKDDHRLTKKDVLHFLPAIIGLISILPYIFESFTYKLAIAQLFIDNPNSIKTVQTHWFYPNYVNTLARPLLLFGYSLVCLYIIWKYTTKKSSFSPTVQKNILIKWLITLSVISFLISLSYLSMTYVFYSTKNVNKEIFNNSPASLLTGFAYVIIPIMMIIFPDILYGIPRISVQDRIKEDENIVNQIVDIQQYNIIEDPFSATARDILNYIEQNKPFLNPKFSINDLIEDLKLPKHHVHYCFNNIIHTKFSTLKNNYRVAHAKSLLLSDKMNLMTVEGIGIESGFASKSHFFAMFKEITKLSPYEFMEQHK